MELNSVFLRVGAVHWYCPRAKGRKRTKVAEISNFSYFYIFTLNKIFLTFICI